MADLTDLHVPGSVGVLACVLDAWSRRRVPSGCGWSLGERVTPALPARALLQAIAARQPGAGLIHHSDQGVQSANHRDVDRLVGIGAELSMSAAGRPTEHARIERCFSTRKREEVTITDDHCLADAHRSLTRCIDEVDNHKRLPSSLGYCPPAEYEPVGR